MIVHLLMGAFIMHGELFQKGCTIPFWKDNKPICPFSNSSLPYVTKDTIEIAETLFDLFNDDIISYISSIDVDAYVHTLQNHL